MHQERLSLSIINFLIILSILLIGSLTTFLLIRSYTLEIVKKLEVDKARKIGNNLRIRLLENFLLNRFDQIEKDLELHLNEGLLKEAIILDEKKRPKLYMMMDKQGRIIRLYKELPEDKFFLETEIIDEKNDQFIYSDSFQIKGTTLGYVNIFFDLSQIKKLSSTTTFFLSVLYFSFFFIGTLVMIILNRKIKNEFSRLIEYAKELPIKTGKILDLHPTFSETSDLLISLNWASLELKIRKRSSSKSKTY